MKPARLRPHFTDPSGGLGYHLRALRYRRTLWAPFADAVRDWLAGWHPRARTLVIVGPSAGWLLDTAFLARFDSVVVLEPDPLARWLLARRFAPTRFVADTLDCFADARGPFALAARFPDAAILFANVIGQAMPVDDGGAWRRALVEALRRHEWASWHDVLSAAAPPAAPAIDAAAVTEDATALARRLWRGPVEVTDHDTLRLDGGAGRYAFWQLAPRQWILAEWVEHRSASPALEVAAAECDNAPTFREQNIMQTQPVMPIAAVVYTPEDDVETLLIEAARALAANGVRLGGVLQHDIGAATGDPCAMLLENVATGERINLSQELGSGSEACRLDPAALAEASVAIRAAIDDGVDLLIFNKFSTQEASGAGLRDEMGLAAVSGVPLLTAVGGRFLDEWKEFTGGECTLLEPRLPAILGWWQALRAETAA